MELIAFWVLLALLVGYGAATKGRNGFGWFLVALLLSPLIGGLFVLFMHSDPKPVPGMQRHAAAPAWGYPENKERIAAPDVTDTLVRLADLRDRGALTNEEYDAQKAEVLGGRKVGVLLGGQK